MEKEMDLRMESKNDSKETAQVPAEEKNESRKTRDSSLIVEDDNPDLVLASEDHHDEGHADYSQLSKAELNTVVKELINENNFSKVNLILKEVRPFFKSIRAKERAAALEKFIAEGGAKDDFEYRDDQIDQEFDTTIKLLRSRKNSFYKDREESKNENLIKKNEILDKLRALEDGEDTEGSFSVFKQLQRDWKSIGPVPNAHARTLWANYSALVDLYYDQRSIYFELKELDRKKNLAYKIELCERAEKLNEEKSVKIAIKELNDFHHEFKHTGPVPREEQDKVWDRFKAASDAVYARRDEFMSSLLETFKNNLVEKKKLIDELNVFNTFKSDRIKEWNQKTKEILETQKRWEAIGAVPRSQTKAINKEFWTAFKGFFNNKNAFFKKLDGDREKNLAHKMDLVSKANVIKDSTDWENTSEELKKLQIEWKKIGPVPEKQREKVFLEFKKACDFFFEKRRDQFGKQDQEQSDNLEQKKLICDELEKKCKDNSGTIDSIQEYTEKFNAIGFVPRKAMKSIKSRFDKAIENYISSLTELSEADRKRLSMEVELSGLRNEPHGERKIQHKEQAIKTQIHKAENDIAILQNNLEFFGRSKNAEKMKSEFSEKLEVAAGHLKDLKKRLKLLKTVS